MVRGMDVHGPSEWHDLPAEVGFGSASVERLIDDDGDAGDTQQSH